MSTRVFSRVFHMSALSTSRLCLVLRSHGARSFESTSLVSASVRSLTARQRPLSFPSSTSVPFFNRPTFVEVAVRMASFATTQASAASKELAVRHDVSKQEFAIKLADDTAVLEYTQSADGTVDLWHTEVPPAFRGKGVAKLLAQAALDHFAEKATPMRLSCTYLQKYVKDFPQPAHQKYIVKD